MTERLINFTLLLIMIVSFATISVTMITKSKQASQNIAKTILGE